MSIRLFDFNNALKIHIFTHTQTHVAKNEQKLHFKKNTNFYRLTLCLIATIRLKLTQKR